MSLNFTYDFANTVRSMEEVFSTVVAQNPITSRLLTIDNSRPFDNIKMEWLDDTTTPLSWTVTTAYTAGAGIILTTDTSYLKTGMIVQFDLPTGARSTLIARVGTIVPNTSFTITVYGGSVDQNLALNTKILLLDKPSLEGSDAEDGDGFEPIASFNYSQIMDEFVQLTQTAYNGKMYGINKTPGEIMNYLIEKKLAQLAFKVGATTVNMPRNAGSATTARTMGGWLWFLKNTVGAINVNASASAINGAILNQAFAEIRNRGGNATTIVANPIQAKRLSALNTSGTNPIININQDSVTTGQYVERFVTDFGDVATIVYSYDMDKNAIAIIDPTKISLRPFINDGFRDMEATQPGSRMLRRRITGQYSLEVKNVKEGHALISNLLV